MSLRLELYSPAHIREVSRLNARLSAGSEKPSFLLPEGADLQFPDDGRGRKPNVTFAKRHFVALDEETVRGGFLLQEHFCKVADGTVWIANIQMPISEGLVDRKFSYVAPGMLQLLLKDQPYVFAVGMGSMEAQFARLLRAMKWRVTLVPFRFFIIKPSHFLSEIRALHSNRALSLAANLSAWSGLGTVALWGVQRARMRRSKQALVSERIYRWSDWTSTLWSRYRTECSFGVVRDETTLPFILDLTDPRLFAFRLSDSDGIPRGWFVLQVSTMLNNKYFGNLRVATLVDAVCDPSLERDVIHSAIACARNQQADLVVMNQQHCRWLAAADDCGFWGASSNYVLAMSPELTLAIGKVDPEFVRIHLARSDGDGRLNL